MYKSPSIESIHDLDAYNFIMACIVGDGDSFCSLSHFFITLQVGSSDCSCFHCRSLIAAGIASIKVDAATARLPLIACCACLDNASAGISCPLIWINDNSIVDNLNNNASEVDLSLEAALTNGIWSVKAVTLLFFMYDMKCSKPATNPHNSALYALYLDSESLNCLEK